jgi:colicin import membrane protein
MSRLEKKCYIVSTVLHGLLVAIFLFGSAFLSPQRKTDLDLKPLTMVPAKLVDGLSGGGGNPTIRPAEDKEKGQTLTQPPLEPPVEPPKVEQTPQLPKPVPEKAETKPTPAKTEEVKLTKPSAKALAQPKDDAKRTPEKQPHVDLTRVVPRSSTSAKDKAKADADAKERVAAAERAAKQRALATLKDATSRLKGFESGTVVEVGGPGGEAYADYGQFVRTVYDEAWLVSDEVSDDNSVAEVRITIARNGDVVSRRISKPSGNRALDRSVQRALDKVKTIGRPFPEGAKESERTFTIEFNLKAKRAFG